MNTHKAGLTSEARAAARILGITVRNSDDLIERVREGFPAIALREIEAKLEITHADLGQLLALPERSFSRRIKTERLSRSESDVLYRIARIHAIAVDTLGNTHKAARWLKKPNTALGGTEPLRSLDTEPGARNVEDLLGRIRYGVYS